jgi:thiamine-monophosphate kinase
VVTIAALGLVAPHQALRRSGARAGDWLYVSGTLGEAAAGLEVLRRDPNAAHDNPLVRRYRYAEPRLELGRRLRGRASAAMDVSDGLHGDLGKLCAASRVGARLDLGCLPIGDDLAGDFVPAECERLALHGGDDYELLFTMPPEAALQWGRELSRVCRLTRIGEIVAGAGVVCLRDGHPVAVAGGGYDHFST